MNKSTAERITGKVLSYLVFFCFAAVTILPFLWMTSTAFKFEQDVFRFPIEWIPSSIRWKNFQDVFTKIPYLNYYWNSIRLSVIITVLTLLTSSLAAYSFAKLRYRGRDQLFLLYLATLMVPWQVIMIPQFMVISKLKLADTHLSLILTQSFTPFGVFLLRQAFMGISEEYSQAAKIDGCTHLDHPAYGKTGAFGTDHIHIYGLLERLPGPTDFPYLQQQKNAPAGTEILPGGTQYFVCTFNGGHLNGAYSGRDGTEADY